MKLRKYLLLLLAITMATMTLPTTAMAAGGSRPTTTKVNIMCVYNGGNSEVYVNRATGSGAASGWDIRYIYSSNILNTNAVFDNLRAALNAPYAAMVPAPNPNATVGLAVSNYGTPDANWSSAEWVASNIIPGSATNMTTGSSGALSAVTQTFDQKFAAEEASQNAAHLAAWQVSEAQNETAWEAAQNQAEQLWNDSEQAKHNLDSDYTPIPYTRDSYKGSTYRKLDFDNAVVTGARTLEANQFETAVGSAFSGPYYTIDSGVIIETYNVQMLMHVTTVYTQSADKTTASASVPLPVSTIEAASDIDYVLRSNLSAIFQPDAAATLGNPASANGDGVKIDYYNPMQNPTGLDSGYSTLAEYHVQLPLSGYAGGTLAGKLTVPLPAGCEGASARIVGGAAASSATAGSVTFPLTLNVSSDTASALGVLIEYKSAPAAQSGGYSSSGDLSSDTAYGGEGEDRIKVKLRNGGGTVTITSLDRTGEDYSLLVRGQSGEPVLAYEISASRKGEATIMFYVGRENAGKEYIVRHKLANGDIEEFRAVCAENGYITVRVKEFSPFAVFAGKTGTIPVGNPDTGAHDALALVSAAAAACFGGRRH